MEKLRVEISGDSKKLEQATDKAIKELKQFEKVAEKSIGGIAKPAAKGAKGIKTLGGASANATPALLEFNRTIQDAPFGIQGVANNIQQLTANFGYLKTQTGSTKNALKAMLAGLSGPQGILLAVSLATALLVAFSNSMGKGATKAEKLAEETKKASEALEKFVDSQTAANRAIIKGEQSAQKEIITLGQLRDVVEDNARSTEDRQKAIQELRRLFPDYFKEISDEKILTGQLTDTYNLLTTAILKRARATALTNELAKNNQKGVVLEVQLLKTSKELTANLEKQNKLEKNAISLISKNARGQETASAKASAAQQKTNDLIQKQIDLAKEIGSLQIDATSITDLINENGGIDLSNIKLPEGETNIKIQSNLELLPLSSDTIQSLNESASNAADTLQGILDKSTKKIQINFESDQIKRAGKTLSNSLIGVKDDMTLAIEGFDKQLNNTIENGIANTLGGLGEAIGNALSGGANAIEAVGAILLSSLGNMMVQLGKQAIITGITIEAVKKALASLNGIGAIAAGVALVAVGSAFSSKAKDLGGNLGSGGASGGVSSGGSSSSGSFSSSSGGFGGGNVVFEISGRNLVGVLKRNTDSNLAING